MHILRLLLRNFRTYEKAEVSFDPQRNLIIGKNGAGKTNLLEAIFFLSTGRSFRTHTPSEMITTGKKYFLIEMEFEKGGVRQSLRCHFDGKKKQLHHNETTYHHFSHALGILPSVLWAPRDIQLLTGTPADRRRFLNLHIAQFDSLYLYHLARYTKALKQRNALLKKMGRNPSSPQETSILAWEKVMAEGILYLMHKREETINSLSQSLASFSPELLNPEKQKPPIHYAPSVSLKNPSSEEILSFFAHHRQQEIKMQSTLFGPHRDELEIYFQGSLAKIFASEGQKRFFLSSLKLMEWQHLFDLTDTPPLFGIDDIGMHLDENYRKDLYEKLPPAQLFLTSPETLDIPPCHTLRIEKGKVYS